jgi:hypothetical protein
MPLIFIIEPYNFPVCDQLLYFLQKIPMVQKEPCGKECYLGIPENTTRAT